MTLAHDYAGMAADLTRLLGLSVPPLAITFWYEGSSPAPRYVADIPAPAADGRTGAVPAGCVFWMKATQATFATEEADHGNCSVGSLTHGFKTVEQVAGNGDVQALLETGWVDAEAVGQIQTVTRKPSQIVYGPLRDTAVDPDVVFLRLNGKQAMILHDSVPDLRVEGKPQCHIVAIAKELGQPALSVGCMLSRVRTGMSNNEMTCALPAHRLAGIIAQIETAAGADKAVAAYASADAQRFN
jgi:uncharacterized protein (DUF169 family)